MRDPETVARSALRRGLFVYGAMLVGTALVLAYAFSQGISGIGYVTVSIVGLVTALLAHQVWQHALDLGSPPVESEGPILRKWQRADLVIVWQSYYIQVGRAIFKIEPLDFHLFETGMAVKLVHFPRTLSVVSVHKQAASPPAEPDSR